MMNKHIISAAALLLLGSAFVANAQNDIAVSGTVKDVYGNPLPGVIVGYLTNLINGICCND